MTILLVDDEPALTNPLSRLLTREGYTVDVATDGRLGSQLASEGNYNLLILDWMLPHLTGLQICQQLRDRGDSTPVLFLTAKDTLDDRVIGLDAGADDYLVKPFELRELLARVRALLRRVQTVDPSPTVSKLQVDDLELDLGNQLAHVHGKSIELSEKETQLLGYLMQHSGQVLTHSQIQAHLWGQNSAPSSNVLAALVRLLRRKIELPGSPELIQTVYGKGYRIGGRG
ncbi:two-component system response regulator RppA [Chamaesiphon sp. OTE_8_metabat_110]|uniref:two-component system response regulator RppA n=1 Tax=Chamaesiphon sp. OTE_8_metabat_110 TaxID=2964696 RepID=UPI00286C8B83|nr:two-component system response regulator RppA [Chamaesiphon sp. OTE_8_metabat_110]